MGYLQTVDISNEFILKRYGNGVKLFEPNYPLNYQDESHSIANLMKLPMNIYFDDLSFQVAYANETSASNCGFDCLDEVLGLTPLEYCKGETGFRLLSQQQKIINANRMMLVEQELMRIKDDVLTSYLSVLFPWYNNENEIVGIFGCSILRDGNSIAASLAMLSELGLLDAPQIAHPPIHASLEKKIFNHTAFTQRENECLNLVMTGKKSKEIAKILSLSHRTVEHYMHNIKRKLNVNTKAELILRIKEGI